MGMPFAKLCLLSLLVSAASCELPSVDGAFLDDKQENIQVIAVAKAKSNCGYHFILNRNLPEYTPVCIYDANDEALICGETADPTRAAYEPYLVRETVLYQDEAYAPIESRDPSIESLAPSEYSTLVYNKDLISGFCANPFTSQGVSVLDFSKASRTNTAGDALLGKIKNGEKDHGIGLHVRLSDTTKPE